MMSGLAQLAERYELMRQELEAKSFLPGKHMTDVDYCLYCHYSREFVQAHGHAKYCLLRPADTSEVQRD